MTEDIDQSDGTGGKHEAARRMAERALLAEQAGDSGEAARLLDQANRADPDAVVAVLQEGGGPVIGDDAGPQNDDEIAAMSRTVEPGSAAPSRAGVSGPGSGADSEGT